VEKVEREAVVIVDQDDHGFLGLAQLTYQRADVLDSSCPGSTGSIEKIVSVKGMEAG
jgi:hypothetical protein